MKYTLLFIFVVLVAAFITYSDTKEKEEALRAKVQNMDIIGQNRELSDVTLSQYKDMELQYNTEYIDQLKTLVESEFEEQLKKFAENELGVIAGYKYMVKYLLKSEREWDSLQSQLSKKYFNSMIIKKKAIDLSNEHIRKISTLRKQFYMSKTGYMKEPQISILQIDESNIYVGELERHSASNLAIEIGTTLLDGLLIMLISYIMVNIIGIGLDFTIAGIMGGVFTHVVSFVLLITISVFLTIYNDNKLLNSIRSQYIKPTIDYDKIASNINNNTIKFYESFK